MSVLSTLLSIQNPTNSIHLDVNRKWCICMVLIFLGGGVIFIERRCDEQAAVLSSVSFLKSE